MSLAEQVVALQREGVDFVLQDSYQRRRVATEGDPAPRRSEAISRLRPGDQLVIATASVLGATRSELLQVLAATAAQGALINDLAAGELISLAPEMEPVLRLAERAESQVRHQQAAKARAGRLVVRGPEKALAGKDRDKVEADWRNPALTADEVVRRHDVSRSTLNREFGPRSGSGKE